MDNKIFEDTTELNRSLGFTESVSIVFGRIVGSGIFRTPGLIMAATGGSVGLFFSSWILGGVATLLGAFCYAEMVSMIPRSGGPYQYLKAAYPPVWTFLRGWAMFFVSETASIVTVSLVFAEYGNIIYESFYGVRYSGFFTVVVTFVLIWLQTSLNLFGVRFSGSLQNIFGLAKFTALISIIFFSFKSGGHVEHFTTNVWPETFGWESVIAVAAALRYAFFAYSGWEGATYVAEEVKNPRKNLPLSILLGIVSVMILYLFVNAAYLYQVSPAEFIEAKSAIASNAMSAVAGNAGGIYVAVAVMISVFGNVSSQVLAKARTWYAMARDGLFPAWMGRLHPVYRTPNNALIGQGIWATVILLFAASSDDIYRDIIDFFSFTSALFNVSTFLALWVLRRKYPMVNRPYRAWGYPVTLWIVLAIQIAFMGITLYDAFLPSLAGILLTMTGLIYYRQAVSKREMSEL